MNSLTKIALATTFALSLGFSVTPTFAQPEKITFEKCLETHSKFMCKLKSIFGSVEKEKKKKTETPSGSRFDEINKRGLLVGLVREVSQSKYNAYKVTCSENKLLDMVEAKNSPKRIISSCFKSATLKVNMVNAPKAMN